jgi:membrane fusion protein, multidrug efflux system
LHRGLSPNHVVMRRILACTLILLASCGGEAAPPKAAAPALVELAVAQARPVERVVRLLGEAAAVDGIMLSSKAAGTVAEVLFTSGSEVTAGQALLRLDSAAEAAAVREAEGERDTAATELRHRQPLLEQGLVSADEIGRLAGELAAKEGALAEALARLAERTVTAPFAGSIGIRRISVGSVLSPGAAIAPLARLDPIQVAFAVPERHLAVLRPGLAVRAASPAWPGRSFAGTVAAVDPGADPATRAIAAVAVLPNPDRALRPGMALTIELIAERLDDAVVVPERAVVVQGGQAAVWTLADGKAVRVPVTIGQRLPDGIHLSAGLAAGTAVVVAGSHALRDGVPAQPAPAAAGAR